MHCYKNYRTSVAECDNGTGYKVVYLNDKGIRKSALVHRLIAMAFIDNPCGYYSTVNHKDGNKHNNSIDNLEWTTYSQNNKHAYDTGLKKTCRLGMYNEKGKLLKIFHSQREANKYLKRNEKACGISECLNGCPNRIPNKAYGYYWKRLNGENEPIE